MSNITIVIPAYNVGGFISRCVSSIFDQDLTESLEVLVIDDGSTDDTSDEIDILRNKYKTLRTIRQSNSGLGATRNIGLKLATSDFIWFVDGDDFLVPGCISAVLSRLDEINPDILVLNSVSADENGKSIDWVKCNFDDFHGRVVDGSDFFEKYYDITYAWLYIFRRDLLLSNQVFFSPRINMQDAEMLPRALSFANSVYVSDIVAYVYVKRNNSFINDNSPDVRLRYFNSVLEVRGLLLGFLSKTDRVGLRLGLASKVRSVNRIIFLSFIYDIPRTNSAKDCFVKIRNSGIFPFRVSDARGLREFVLSLLVNLSPIFFPRVYFQLRNMKALKRIAALMS